jgi:hypothetical protein
MNPINFEQYKEQIQAAIEVRLKQGIIKDPMGFILIDGFISLSYNKDVTNSLIVGGPSIPSIAVVGKSTGLIHTFALKVLIPNIQL